MVELEVLTVTAIVYDLRIILIIRSREDTIEVRNRLVVLSAIRSGTSYAVESKYSQK